MKNSTNELIKKNHSLLKLYSIFNKLPKVRPAKQNTLMFLKTSKMWFDSLILFFQGQSFSKYKIFVYRLSNHLFFLFASSKPKRHIQWTKTN